MILKQFFFFSKLLLEKFLGIEFLFLILLTNSILVGNN